MNITFARSPLAALWMLALAAACTPPPAVAAVGVARLYEGVVPGDGGEAGRTAAAVDALRQVVVRLTGQRAAATDAALAPLYADARRYVQTFRAEPGGQVAVGFDAEALVPALARAGQKLWPRDRSLTLLVIVSDRPGPARGLGAMAAPELRLEIERTAELRGLPLVWPAGLEAAAEQAVIADALAGRLEALLEVAHRYAADGVLLGRVGAAGATWSWLGPAGSGTLSGAAGEAVQVLADRYGAQFAVAAAGSGQLTVLISGVHDLAGYGAALGALGAIGGVQQVDLDEVAGDTLRLRVAYGGDATALRQAAALGGRLAPGEEATADGPVKFVLRP
jgi:hypothetical protein